jgi:hypothetical protein
MVATLVSFSSDIRTFPCFLEHVLAIELEAVLEDIATKHTHHPLSEKRWSGSTKDQHLLCVQSQNQKQNIHSTAKANLKH